MKFYTDKPNEPPDEEGLKEFERFWAPIVCDTRGRLKRNQVIKELLDYSMVMDNVSKVYEEMTGGVLSKPHYLARGVVTAMTDFQNKAWKETLENEKEAWTEEHEDKVFALNQEIAQLRTKLLKLEDIVEGRVASVQQVCYVALRSGPPKARPATVSTAAGTFKITWDSEYDIIVLDKNNPLPDEWIDTVLDACKELDKKEK